MSKKQTTITGDETLVIVNGVKVGDTYIDRNKYKCTVIDIYEVRSLKTGKLIRFEIMAEKEVCGQKVTFQTYQSTIFRCNNR